MINMLTTLAKSVLIPLKLTAVASAADLQEFINKFSVKQRKP